ncbi:hypothetical protein PAEPH01_0711 [Pancytospora epiphaga]|nr:hypothetical protein PAEPH01_0711 [Pancytospora epiphaga]
MPSIRISLKNRSYFPCDCVKGRLTVLTKEPCKLDKLELFLYRTCKLEITNEKHTKIPLFECSKNDKGHQFTIALNKELCAGEHIFPFSFVLSGLESASGKMNEKLNNYDWAYTSLYQLEGIGTINGKEERSKIDVPIYNRLASIPYIDIKFKINGILCLKRLTYLYRIVTDRTFYKTGDLIHVNCFPTSVCSRSVVSEIKLHLQEIALYRDGKTEITGSKLISTGKCQRLDKNEFKGEIRIPFNLCGTVISTNYSIQTVIEFEIRFYRGWPIKVKKYIDVGKSTIVIPKIEELSTFSGIKYNEVFLDT